MQPKVIALIAAFAATVPLAHWMTGNIGTACVTDGPCLLPVGFGLGAPSGALAIGASFVLRDAVHEVGGARAALVAIAIGGILSAMFAAPALIFASMLAWLSWRTLRATPRCASTASCSPSFSAGWPVRSSIAQSFSGSPSVRWNSSWARWSGRRG